MNSSLERLRAAIRSAFGARGTNGAVLADASYRHLYIVATTLRIAEAAAKVLGARLEVLHIGASAKAEKALIESHRPNRTLTLPAVAIRGLLRHPWRCLKAGSSLANGAALVEWAPEGIPVGRHLYDSLLIGTSRSRLFRLSVRDRMRTFREIAFFWGLWDYFRTTPPRFAILPDNTYRNGLLFELCAAFAVPSIAGIDSSGVSMHAFRDVEDYSHHCRTPEASLVQQIASDLWLNSVASQYLADRTAAKEQQHDVVRAYASSKRDPDRATLAAEHGFDPRRPIVFVLAHVFSDAPHAYPGTLFQDYDAWLRWTVRRLLNHPRVQVLVKRHPSSALYGEDDLLERILSDEGARTNLLADDVNTRALFGIAAAVVTCGGTAGMEFPCFGVPVIVAARPPYADLGYVHCPADLESYAALLDRIDLLPPIGKLERESARAALWLINSGMKVAPARFGFGEERIRVGEHFDFESMALAMTNDMTSGQRELVAAVEALIRGPAHNLTSDVLALECATKTQTRSDG